MINQDIGACLSHTAGDYERTVDRKRDELVKSLAWISQSERHLLAHRMIRICLNAIVCWFEFRLERKGIHIHPLIDDGSSSSRSSIMDCLVVNDKRAKQCKSRY